MKLFLRKLHQLRYQSHIPDVSMIRRKDKQWFLSSFITSPVRAVAKYCDKYECICLYVRQDISRTTHTIFIKCFCMLPMSISRSSCGTFKIGRITYCRKGLSSPMTMHHDALAAKWIMNTIANNVMQHKGSFRRCHVR